MEKQMEKYQLNTFKWSPQNSGKQCYNKIIATYNRSSRPTLSSTLWNIISIAL